MEEENLHELVDGRVRVQEDPSGVARVEHLLSLFREQLVAAREAVLDLPTAEVLPLRPNGKLDRKLGDYFILVGRDNTARLQIEGAARVFETFMSFFEDVREGSSLLMAVGCPGVGKTTVGRDMTGVLRKFWEQNPDEVDAILSKVLNPDLVDNLKTRVENSKGFHCRMYRCLEATPDGLPLQEENGLSAAQLLALNALFGALQVDEHHPAANRHGFVHSYTSMLSTMDASAPGLKQQLRFSDVIAFIRKGLSVEDGKEIFLSWFFDEANVSVPAPGCRICWFQEMMSEFVHWLHSHRRGDTFVVATAATTKFSVATLRNTASTSKARSVFIPMNPLSKSDCENIVSTFVQRLAKTVGDVDDGMDGLPVGVQDIIALSGGNPRLLSYILTAFCTPSATEDLAPEDLLKKLRLPLTKERMQCIINYAWALVEDSYDRSSSYMPLIFAALQASLLGKQVHRSDQVLPGTLTDTWGDLEAAGMVGLHNNHIQSAVTLGGFPARVVFPPLLLRYIFSVSNDTLSLLVPPLEDSNWKVKEKADLYTIMFLILLQRQLTDKPTFKLSDILPQRWYVPPGLTSLEFYFPASDLDWSVKQAGQLKTPQSFWTFMEENTRSWAFIGPQNYAADSWLRLTCARTNREMLFVFESKCCACPMTRPVVNYSGSNDGIIEKALKDLRPILYEPQAEVGKKRKGAASTTKTFSLNQIVFFFVSDQDISRALEAHKMACSGGRATGLASRLIIGDEHSRDSPFCHQF